jgi:hypothetical protein
MQVGPRCVRARLHRGLQSGLFQVDRHGLGGRLGAFSRCWDTQSPWLFKKTAGMAGLARSCCIARCYFHPTNPRRGALAVYAKHVAKRYGIEAVACTWRCWVSAARASVPLSSLLTNRKSGEALLLLRGSVAVFGSSLA